MMEALLARGEEIARTAQAERIGRIASALEGEGVPGMIRTAADSVAISGKGVLRQWLTQPLLRFAGSVLP